MFWLCDKPRHIRRNCGMGEERQEVIDAVHKVMCCDVMQEHGAKVTASMAVGKEGPEAV